MSLLYNLLVNFASVTQQDRLYTYAGAVYANPHAVTQLANGYSTTTFAYDANGNVAQEMDGTTTTYVIGASPVEEAGNVRGQHHSMC